MYNCKKWILERLITRSPVFFCPSCFSSFLMIRQVGCFLLHVEQVNFFRQSLNMWPLLKHPKYNLFSLTNRNLFSSVSVLNLEHASNWWSIFLKNVHCGCCFGDSFDSLEFSSIFWIEWTIMSPTSCGFGAWCVLSDAVPPSFTRLQDEIRLDARSALIKVVKVFKSEYLFCSFISLVACLFHREISQSGNLASNFIQL